MRLFTTANMRNGGMDIYDNNDSVFEDITGVAALSSSHSSTKVHENHYYNEYHEGILEIANSLLKILLNQMVT